MFSMFSHITEGLWVDIAAVAAGLILVIGLLVISRRGPKKPAARPPRTEAQAREAQADRDRLAGRR